MGKALYRKYRSKSLSEIVGQEHITTALTHALNHEGISHAYLFTGPHGIGKTSIARILAFEVNGFPYDETSLPVDIIEIDAASNRRIDEMRDLRDRVSIAPVQGKYKVYIIDEVHMLTREAFNALLKTLEEPPAHVIFILATTEAHKLPDTIISRTQRYTFKPVDAGQVAAHLRTIAKAENIDITDEALEVIARHGQGSFRDSISLLDQMSQHKGKVDAETIYALLGVPPDAAISDLVSAIPNGAHAIFEQLALLRDKGYDASRIANQLNATFRKSLVEKTIDLPDDLLLQSMQRLLQIPAAYDPYAALEIALVGMSLALEQPSTKTHSSQSTKAAASTPLVSVEIAPSKIKPKTTLKKEATPKFEPKKTEKLHTKDAETENKQTTKLKVPQEVTDFDWEACLAVVKKRYNTLYGVLRMANVEQAEDTVTLTFNFGFHQKKIADKKHRQVLSDIITEQCGQSFTINAVVDKNAAVVQPPLTKSNEQPALDKVPPQSESVAAISNIFGGAEVLE